MQTGLGNCSENLFTTSPGPGGSWVGFWLLIASLASACSADSTNAYLAFVRARAAELHASHPAAATLADWKQRAPLLRQQIQESWGKVSSPPAGLNPRVLGVIHREGYRIERLVFQTFPGMWMTANAYVPNRPGRLPALLAVHGHWAGAKQDPVVQARCIGPAQLGYFVLAVDAFGAGERGVGKALGEYHGDMTAATLLPSGLTLAGIQVFENSRAVDYLCTRPEVDRQRIAITGASGGGNQTMYAGAWDARFDAVIPVCSVGNYQAYLGAACCLCEVIPGALKYTEEGGILALTAPRALLVMSASRDARQFSAPEATRSIAQAKIPYQWYHLPSHLAHAVFESGHDYNQPMRERLYGWLAKHLRQAHSEEPISEPDFQTEPPESLRCFPGTTRPDDWITLPQFAAREANRVLQSKKWPGTLREWKSRQSDLVDQLRTAIAVPSSPSRSHAVEIMTRTNDTTLEIRFSPEPGIRLKALYHPGHRQDRTAILLDLEGTAKAEQRPLTQRLKAAGWSVTTLDLRATGDLAWPGDKIGRAPDHTTAEWGLWIGRPLLGQWTVDVLSLLDVLGQVAPRAPHQVGLVGFGPAGLVAYSVAALDHRIGAVLTEGTLATYVSDLPYEQQRLGTIVPGILRRTGDIPHLIALLAPRPVWIDSPVNGIGQPLPPAEQAKLLHPSSRVWNWFGQDRWLRQTAARSEAEKVEFLERAVR
jgi:cephalosporin-C deacetylase-like acetyl esterase